MKEIKYIGFYDLEYSVNKRVSSPAAISKMNYICDAINAAGFKVHIVSPSWFENKYGKKYQPQETIDIKRHIKVTLSPSFRTHRHIFLYLKIFISLCWLFYYLLRNTDSEDRILVYHSPWLYYPIYFAKKIKKFQLILEVEEIYADVNSLNSTFEMLEKKLIKAADKFILATELLADKISDNKPLIIIYGIYRHYDRHKFPPNDGKIHLLYAGIIDTHKAGAFNAIAAAPYLGSNYVMHIIGFGEEKKLQAMIDDINFSSECKIYFEGSLSGSEYLNYCQTCHVGLSTQNNFGKYVDTSFPSKILSYLSMGLRVVSCRINVVERSRINSLMVYYENNDPIQIAEAIKAIAFEIPFDSRMLMEDLNDNFVCDIKRILNLGL